MTERLTDPKTIQQQEQQHAERNRSAVQRGLQHARQQEEHPDERNLPDTDPPPRQSKSS
jgi:hypothetical protein